MRIKRLSAVLLIPAAAHAEVIDKLPSLSLVIGSALAATLLAYLSARYWPWTLLLVLPFGVLLLGGAAMETINPYIGPAMAEEAGTTYVVMPWVGLISVLLATGAGLWRHRCASKKMSEPSSARSSA